MFRHPAAHNLEWHDVRSLLAALADVAEGTNGALQVTRNGQAVTLHAPKHKDVAVEDVLTIRRFLEQSAEPAVPTPVASATDLLVVIDHSEAKAYRTEAHGFCRLTVRAVPMRPVRCPVRTRHLQPVRQGDPVLCPGRAVAAEWSTSDGEV